MSNKFLHKFIIRFITISNDYESKRKQYFKKTY